MRFKQFLIEQEKEKQKKIVFKETDGRSPFPSLTISALEKRVTTFARDLETEWKSAAELVDTAFAELDVPKPQSFITERWKQYTELLAHAVKQLYRARGLKSGWTRGV